MLTMSRLYMIQFRHNPI